MVERAGCVTGSRGYGPRKFKGVQYDVYKVYVAAQASAISQEAQDKLNAENLALMEHDRLILIEGGYQTKVRHLDCGQVHVLYRR